MDRNSRFSPYNRHSVVNRNNIAVPLDTRTDQQSNSTSRLHDLPLLPPPRPPQIPPELLAHHPPSASTQQIEIDNQTENKEGTDDDDSSSESVEETQVPISFRSFGNLFAYYFNNCRRLSNETEQAAEETETSKSVLKDLLENAQAENLSLQKQIVEMRKVNEQQMIWKPKYEKLNETYTSAKNELQDKNHRIDNLEKVIKQIKGQFEDSKSKVRSFEVSEKKLKQELKDKSKEYTNLESNYNAKCTELKCKSEDMIKLEREYNIKSTKVTKLNADLLEQTKINTKLKNFNEKLKKKKVKLNRLIIKKNEEISKLSEELNSVKQANQNITSASSELGESLTDIFSRIDNTYFAETTKTHITNTVVQDPSKKHPTWSDIVKGGHGGSGGGNINIPLAQKIENNSVDLCDRSDGVNQNDCVTSKILLKEIPNPPKATTKCAEDNNRKTPEVSKEPDPENGNCGNKGNPKIILRISKLKIEKS